MEKTINVKGMTCGGCERAIERALRARPGVIAAQASYVKGRVVVQYDPDEIGEAELRRAIESAGYQAA